MATTNQQVTDGHYIGKMNPFYQDMNWLVNNDKFSDVKFVFGEEEDVIYGHKCILAARCEYFKQLFNNGDAVDTHWIDEISREDFGILLEFIYTNCCSKLSRENIFDVLAAGNKIGLDKLTKVCEQFLLKNIRIETVCEYMEAAVTFGLEELKQELMLYYEGHTLDVLNQDSVNEMSAATLAFILQSTKLKIDEFDIYLLVRNWGTVNSLALEQPVSEVAKEVAKLIRLPLLTSEELSRIESENEDQLIPVEQMSQAWKHLALKTPSGGSLNTTPRRGTKERKQNKAT